MASDGRGWKRGEEEGERKEIEMELFELNAGLFG